MEPEAAAAPVEGWIALSQSTLGSHVDKPRLLAERLRKPPFRFLFDITVEVARQTGFLLAELFGGELSQKPAPPGSREEKIMFLERWVQAVAARLGSVIAGDLANVSGQNIVCGLKPAWTNYLLQCTAAAAWPGQHVLSSAAMALGSAALEDEPAPAAVDAAPPAAPAAAPLADAAPLALAPPAEAAAPEMHLPQEPQEPSVFDKPLALPTYDVNFGDTLNQFNALQDAFAKTSEQWNNFQAKDEIKAEDDIEGEDDIDIDAVQLRAQQHGVAGETQVMNASFQPLQQAAVVASRVDEEVKRAEDLLATIEMGLDSTDLEINRKRELAAQLEEAKRLEEERLVREAQEAIEAEAQAAERKRAEKEAAKAARRAEKAARKAEEAARPVFPVSKYSQEHGARIVASLNDDEYEWDGDDAEQAAEGATEESNAAAAGAAEAPADSLEQEAPPLTGAAAFDLSAVLGDEEDTPAAPGFMDGIDLTKPLTGPLIGGSLFDKLKTQLKETFISYLCASMPESLLKQYQQSELIGCLQFLLKELRRHLVIHGLEDVVEEEPTSIAEELRQNSLGNWLDHLQGASPGALRGKYDVTELIDTLQALAQTCLERLEDALGPVTRWAEESSPLRYVPPLEPPPPIELDTPTAAGVEEQRPSSSLGAAPWQAEAAPARPAPVGALAAGGMAATMSEFKPRTYADASSAGTFAATAHQFHSPAPAPMFDATLGPAIWEQEMSSRPIMPGTSSSRPCGTGAVGTRGGMPATAHRGRPFTHHTGHVR
mmetsp:Transcript_100220/g.184036  ORF Transcript_100220/g.184036 Transcript_100220/m.184036 type:complete len:772 (-) Transcript_100220:80-2395(-)